MLKKVKLAKTNSPEAFMPKTLTKSIEKPYEHSHGYREAELYIITYSMDAYHTTLRTNGKMGLAFGKANYFFRTLHSDIFEQYNDLDYEGLLEAVVKPKSHYNASFEENFTVAGGAGTDMVWDGTSFWLNPDKDAVSLMANVFPKLVAAYPNLPDVPAGADGWYKVK